VYSLGEINARLKSPIGDFNCNYYNHRSEMLTAHLESLICD